MITFSGLDCAGKSTQIELIKKYLDSKSVKSRVIWSRGGYTSWVEGIKNLVRKDKNFTQREKTEFRREISQNSKKMKLLLLASIWDLVRYYGIVFRLIEASGLLILCDRYIWDTYIDFKIKYPQFDFERWLSWRILMKLIKKPDFSIIFFIPIDVSMQRSIEKNDPHSETKYLRMKRLKLYEIEISKNRWSNVIDGQLPIEVVTEKVKGIINL
ncbi:MAG: hypothetical protein EOM50_10530 [Erysipelotrichia bacterium]|nr:hypothetical protein [Erysipelotrichia bacterium]